MILPISGNSARQKSFDFFNRRCRIEIRTRSSAEIEMSANEHRDQECGKHRQLGEDRASIRTLESKSNLIQGHIGGRPAANDNAKAWPLIPFPDNWLSS
jgi:hypothetical protein